MPDIDTCLEAKKKGTIGTILSVIGHILLSILGILVIVMFAAPIYATDIMYFLYFFGWIMAIIGVILAVIGYLLIKKRNNACSIA